MFYLLGGCDDGLWRWYEKLKPFDQAVAGDAALTTFGEEVS